MGKHSNNCRWNFSGVSKPPNNFPSALFFSRTHNTRSIAQSSRSLECGLASAVWFYFSTRAERDNQAEKWSRKKPTIITEKNDTLSKKITIFISRFCSRACRAVVVCWVEQEEAMKIVGCWGFFRRFPLTRRKKNVRSRPCKVVYHNLTTKTSSSEEKRWKICPRKSSADFLLFCLSEIFEWLFIHFFFRLTS